MAAEDAQDPLKGMDLKSMGNVAKGSASASSTVGENSQPIIKKRLRKKIRHIPEYYFLPRKSIPAGIAFYGSFIVAGVGAGMLLEGWINKKVKEDGGGVIWEFK